MSANSLKGCFVQLSFSSAIFYYFLVGSDQFRVRI